MTRAAPAASSDNDEYVATETDNADWTLRRMHSRRNGRLSTIATEPSAFARSSGLARCSVMAPVIVTQLRLGKKQLIRAPTLTDTCNRRKRRLWP